MKAEIESASNCALCREGKTLRNSHIIPKFVWKYLKESAGAGGFRIGTNPNKPVQDGFKEKLLCSDCEQKLGRWENSTAKQIFLPMMKKGGGRFCYDDNFSHFCVSITWRILTCFKNLNQLKHMSPAASTWCNIAEESWRNHMQFDGHIDSQFEHHFLPIPAGPATPTKLQNTPPNINRYLSRSIDMDVVAVGPDSGIVYAKLCRLLIIGFINISPPHGYKGTKLTYGNGRARNKKFELPAELGDYMMLKAKKMLALQRNMSDGQKSKIADKTKIHADEIAKSANFEAMMFDVNTFGAAAFDND